MNHPPAETMIERFAAMGTRFEIHVFGGCDADAVPAARRAIEALDDALTTHRPSATADLNERLLAGRPALVRNALLWEALDAVDAAYVATGGLFDPAVEHGSWSCIRRDRAASRIEATQPAALDFGAFGKGFALDHAAAILKQAGVRSALLSAGESSITVLGEHPLGGGWPFAVPHPLDPGRSLIDLELTDEAMSISSTVGSPERAAMIRPQDGARIGERRTTIVIEPSGAEAEAMSTALLVAGPDSAAALLGSGRRYRFDLDRAAAPEPVEVAA
ncbi:FAD:protein FMN transferase [Sphingomonas aracearum]|uniref:FAD:protein FMN transferase n=1 Tax=Sphingomonas aracearum TaxID=2283317 RepID=A0A369VZV6_9SPHN|nr:FAD:protein FMN transferase [Sphingomonas aracearum]RDE07329.1 FAD:protein FMN transferase [Sphingomonas aracearum]